jgi:hypothetical protein
VAWPSKDCIAGHANNSDQKKKRARLHSRALCSWTEREANVEDEYLGVLATTASSLD